MEEVDFTSREEVGEIFHGGTNIRGSFPGNKFTAMEEVNVYSHESNTEGNFTSREANYFYFHGSNRSTSMEVNVEVILTP